MMKKIFLCFLACMLIASACKKNEYITYSEKSGLAFASRDSLFFSFISEAVAGNEDTLLLNIRLTGVPADTDLTFLLEPDPASTAVENIHYKLAPAVFPAHVAEMQYPVIIMRATDLQNDIKILKLNIRENGHFGLGAISEVRTGTFQGITTHPSFTLALTDQVTRPGWWTSVETIYYGAYSNTKYRFMVEICGISNFSQGVLNYAQIVNYQALLRAAVIEYEKEHSTPLLDENGQVVTF